MKIGILPAALEDLADGFWFYEDQQEGLGAYFLDPLFSDIDSLKLYAGIHRKYFGYHRLLSKRFPYMIYYRKEDDLVSIKAVSDGRRNPKWIRRKLM